jgi:integrase
MWVSDTTFRPARPRTVRAVAKVAGGPALTPHDLCHQAGTLMLLAGTPVHEVAVRLNHQAVTTTLSAYAEGDLGPTLRDARLR